MLLSARARSLSRHRSLSGRPAESREAWQKCRVFLFYGQFIRHMLLSVRVRSLSRQRSLSGRPAESREAWQKCRAFLFYGQIIRRMLLSARFPIAKLVGKTSWIASNSLNPAITGILIFHLSWIVYRMGEFLINYASHTRVWGGQYLKVKETP